MGVAENIPDMEEGTLEIGMGMCLTSIGLPLLINFLLWLDSLWVCMLWIRYVNLSIYYYKV